MSIHSVQPVDESEFSTVSQKLLLKQAVTGYVFPNKTRAQPGLGSLGRPTPQGVGLLPQDRPGEMRQLRASGCSPEQPALTWEVARLVGRPRGTLVSRKPPCTQHLVSTRSRHMQVPRPATPIFTWGANGTRKLFWGRLPSVQSRSHLKRTNLVT